MLIGKFLKDSNNFSNFHQVLQSNGFAASLSAGSLDLMRGKMKKKFCLKLSFFKKFVVKL